MKNVCYLSRAFIEAIKKKKKIQNENPNKNDHNYRIQVKNR